MMNWVELRNIITRGYRRYLRKHGGIRPCTVGSFHTAVAEHDLTAFEDQWQALFDAVK